MVRIALIAIMAGVPGVRGARLQTRGIVPALLSALDDPMNLEEVVQEWRSLYLKVCPLCSGERFGYEDLFAMPDAHHRPRAFEVLPLVCLSCGYTVLVSAAALKLAKPAAGF